MYRVWSGPDDLTENKRSRKEQVVDPLTVKYVETHAKSKFKIISIRKQYKHTDRITRSAKFNRKYSTKSLPEAPAKLWKTHNPYNKNMNPSSIPHIRSITVIVS